MTNWEPNMRVKRFRKGHVKIKQVFLVESKKNGCNYNGGTGFVIVIGWVACVSHDIVKKGGDDVCTTTLLTVSCTHLTLERNEWC